MAAPFIDKHFLETSVLIGQPDKPERMFGDEAWAGFLRASFTAAQYGPKPLTIDFMAELHRQLLLDSAPEKGGLFLHGHGGRGGSFANGKFLPITLDENQRKNVMRTGWTSFKATDPTNPNVGFIDYFWRSEEEVQKELQAICDEYNSSSNEDPFVRAARLQRRFVSCHPFVESMSGRLSRIIMNWALTTNNRYPSVPADFDADLLVSPEEWTELVKVGSFYYDGIRSRWLGGATDPVDIFGLRKEYRRYQTPGRPFLRIQPNGADHDHTAYKAFLADLRRPLGAVALAN